MYIIIFGPIVMLRQPHVWASRASPAQKWQGLRVAYSKNFSRATFGRYTLAISKFLCKENAGAILKPLLISNE